MNKLLTRLFPFTSWIPDINRTTLRIDLIAGITVALVLIPQSVAYAQLAGLPPYYGLYAAFLPPMVAALFGSSRQLATGPVAVVSLITAATLEPLAAAGSEAYIAYAIVLSVAVGLLQMGLGVLRLGVIVNFLSHPVVNGFTNAAALIIASSQLSKLFGVYVDKGEHHYETVYRVVRAAIEYTHWPTLGLAALAFVLMYGLKRINPRIPFVLLAVGVTTTIAWGVGLEHNASAPASAIQSAEVRSNVTAFNKAVQTIETLSTERAAAQQKLSRDRDNHAPNMQLLHQQNTIRLLDARILEQKEISHVLREKLRGYQLRNVSQTEGTLVLYPRAAVPQGSADDGRCWRIKVSNRPLDPKALPLTGGGAVVGTVPSGLPALTLPKVDLKTLLGFLAAAAIISLLGFMEAISIAKSMAAKTGQRLDPNQELIGQGLANLLGAVGNSYPVSGSFSRSAVNLGAGAVTGLSSVFTSLTVAAALLFFTPLLYHIPQSVLAAVIMMAVVGLINVRGFIHAYRAQRYDGVIAVITFLCTFFFAPHLDRGIMVGVALSVGHYLYRFSRPSLAYLSLHPDFSLRDAYRHGLAQCRNIAVIRFDGPLFFANTSYLEERINERIQSMPELRHILLPANGINEIDASGEEALSLIIDSVRERGIGISFSGLNEKVVDMMKRTHLQEKIGEDNIYPTMMMAVRSIHAKAHVGSTETECPLLDVRFEDAEMFAPGKPALRNVSALVVDHDPEVAQRRAEALKRSGIEATACLPGRWPGDRELRPSPDVVVAELNGLNQETESMFNDIRDTYPEAEIIVLSPHESAAVMFRLAKMGAYEHLALECDDSLLTKTINRAVYDARTRRGSSRPAGTP